MKTEGPVRIGFTGHRNVTTDESHLEKLLQDYPNATWIHGGAQGFDRQVAQFARQRGIATEVFLPNYARWGKTAPLFRNCAIVNCCDFLVACWDGRESGGTFYTINYAKQETKKVLFLEARGGKG